MEIVIGFEGAVVTGAAVSAATAEGGSVFVGAGVLAGALP